MVVPAARLRAALWPDTWPDTWPDQDARPPPDAYVLLDGARDRTVLPLIRRSGADYRCLYEGRLAPDLAGVAPYLVHLRQEAPTTNELLALAAGSAGGIFATSAADLEALRRHFRRFLRVRTEDGRNLLFRFYDPRVFRAYLPTCTDEELAVVFGPIAAYLYEAEEVGTLIVARREATGMKMDRLGPMAWIGSESLLG